jgi:enamine deaminase RidA (YjgF/YER057c/UK114 family)
MSTNRTNAGAEQRLKELGIVLPRPPAPLGAYVEAVQAGNLLFLSGTLPVEGGAPKFLGRIGGELTLIRQISCAEVRALN